MSEVIINNVKFKNVPDKRYGTKIGDLLTQSNVGMSQTVADYIQSDDFYALVNGVDIDWNSIEVEDGLVLNTTADLINWIVSIINKIPLVKIISVVFSTEKSFPTSEEIQQLLDMSVQDFARYGSKYQYYFYLKKEQKYYFIPAAYNKDNTNVISIRGIDDIAELSFHQDYSNGVLSFSERQAPDLSNYYTKTEVNTLLDGKIDSTLKGAKNGVASLDSTGKVPASQLPSYVDDVLEGYLDDSHLVESFSELNSYNAGEIVLYLGTIYRFKVNHAPGIFTPDEMQKIGQFPAEGETGKIYSDIITGKTYRWSGSTYVPIKGDVVIGTTQGTAFDGAAGAALQTQVSGISTQVAGKVDKETGKGLSSNDYTNEEKQKVADALVPADIAEKANASDVYTKAETYSKTEVNNLITTPNQQYVSVTATAQTTAVTDVLPATGAADTTYRVGCWDGTQYNDSVFSEYAWNGSAYIKLSTKAQVGEVYDISTNHVDTKYSDLAAALGTDGANIPSNLRKGGMSVKFVQSSDNKYVQYRLMADSWSATPSDWQGVDDEPTAGSQNLVKSGGVALWNIALDISHLNAEDGVDKIYNDIGDALSAIPAAYRKDHISVISFTDGTYRHLYERITATRSYYSYDWRCLASDIDALGDRAAELNIKAISSLFGSINNLETSGLWGDFHGIVVEETSSWASFVIYIPKGITEYFIDNCTSVYSIYVLDHYPVLNDVLTTTATKTVVGTTATVSVESNPNGMWHLINVNKNNDLKAVAIRNTTENEISEMMHDVSDIRNILYPITIESCNAYITNTGVWTTNHATIYGALIPIKPNDVVTIVSDIETQYYSVLKDNVIVRGSTPNYATGYSGRVSGMPNNVTMPSDAAYLWFDISWGSEVLPSNLIINGIDRLISLEDTVGSSAEKVNELYSNKDYGKQAFLYKSANEFVVASKFNNDRAYDLVIHFGLCMQNGLNTIFSFKRACKVPNTSSVPNANVSYDAGEVIFTQTSDCILATRFNRYSDYSGTSDADRAYSSGYHALKYNNVYYKTAETVAKTITADGVVLNVGDFGSADEIVFDVITNGYNPFVLYDSLVADVNNPDYSTLFVEHMTYRMVKGCIECVDSRVFQDTCYMETYGGFASMANTLQYGYFPNGESMENQQTDKFGALSYNVGVDLPSGSTHRALKSNYPEFSHFIRRNSESTIFESIFMSDYGAGNHSEVGNNDAIYWVYNAGGLDWKKVYHRVTYNKTFNAGDRQKMCCLYSWFKPYVNNSNYIVYNAGNTVFIDVKGAFTGVIPVPCSFAKKPYEIVEQTTNINSVGSFIDADGLEITATGEGSVILKINL